MTSPSPLNQYPEERRLATVLLADIQGLSRLAERMDFEIVTNLIKDVWLLVDEIIGSHGGYVDKHIGDTVMAIWGAPFSGENDAEQALRAALALQKAIKEYAESSELPGSSGIKLRVGINSGMVLAGYVGKRSEYTVMGDTVNIATQIQQVCEVEKIYISESTLRLVRGIFELRRISPSIILRGKTTPTLLYQVEGLMPQPSRTRYHSLDSMETFMVGREVELERLAQIYKQTILDEKPNLVLISGESGIGKSRLLMEFTSQLEAEDTPATLISARALEQTSQVPFYLWKSLWSLRFGLKEIDSAETAREKFLREIQKLWGFHLGPASSVEVAHLVGNLIGIHFEESPFLDRFEGDKQKRLERSYELTRELLTRMSALRPLILLLDDLQYADNGSLDLILSLAKPSITPLPLLILGGARPEFAQRNPSWLNQTRIIELGPLAVNSQIISLAYPALRIYPESVLKEISERSDGNPYFMEELAKSLIKSGLSPDDLDEGELIQRIRKLPLESLRVMLQARLDSLSREARSVAMMASVVGRVFWVGAVLAAVQAADKLATGGLPVTGGEVVDRLVQDALRQLVRAELAFPRANSSFTEDQEYIFKHSLLRDTAYGLIPHKHLTIYHHAVARWLEAHMNADFKLMAAAHYEMSNEYTKAAQLYDNAAEDTLRQGAAREAEELFAQASRLRTLNRS